MTVADHSHEPKGEDADVPTHEVIDEQGRTAEDNAGAVLFLVGEDADSVTGELLSVDGG